LSWLENTLLRLLDDTDCATATCGATSAAITIAVTHPVLTIVKGPVPVPFLSAAAYPQIRHGGHLKLA
jgi:hypothetical protein